jgi:hypothetical protein
MLFAIAIAATCLNGVTSRKGPLRTTMNGRSHRTSSAALLELSIYAVERQRLGMEIGARSSASAKSRGVWP